MRRGCQILYGCFKVRVLTCVQKQVPVSYEPLMKVEMHSSLVIGQ
jgi:hypothetical protein